MLPDLIEAEGQKNSGINFSELLLGLKIDLSLIIGGIAYPMLLEEDPNYSISEFMNGELLNGLDRIVEELGLNGISEREFRFFGFKKIVSGAIIAVGGLHERIKYKAITEVLNCADSYAQKHFSEELGAKNFWSNVLDAV